MPGKVASTITPGMVKRQSAAVLCAATAHIRLFARATDCRKGTPAALIQPDENGKIPVGSKHHR
ncbi:hypothetical protein [Anaerolinea sp.]|uniref:hypothetical protein n=1 Tax=Anaerolinea sp. TaxID=1872519 RepID=UPI002ACD4F0F|nr:hypothetical protein [Anaerolinea sp.]